MIIAYLDSSLEMFRIEMFIYDQILSDIREYLNKKNLLKKYRFFSFRHS